MKRFVYCSIVKLASRGALDSQFKVRILVEQLRVPENLYKEHAISVLPDTTMVNMSAVDALRWAEED